MRRFGLPCVVSGLLLLSAGLRAQERVVVADLGPGPAGRIVRDVLRRPHRLVQPDTSWFVLPRAQAVRTNLVVLGRTAAISGKVDGDVVVVGGDLFVRPGAEISGRAVAVGGGVYSSTLSFMGRGSESFRDDTFDVERTADGYRLVYRSLLGTGPSRPIAFPFVYGLRAPAYDRVNGMSQPFGPTLSFGKGRGLVNALVTYRSDLGKVDPHLDVEYQFTRTSRVNASAERGTFSNDAWIWSDFVNSLATLVAGADSRNYYRADRGELRLHRLFEFTQWQIEPFLGGRGERAWPVGPFVGENRGPWSAFGRTDLEGMLRPNPQFARNDLITALAGAGLLWNNGDLEVRARSESETALHGSTPDGPAPFTDAQFVQFTSDLYVGFPTFGEQEYELDVHWVTTAGDTPPPQKFVYLGGPGTLPFLDMLQQGGDELLFVEQHYSIPIQRMQLRFLGIPTIHLRHRIGSAGLGELPRFEQMLGLGVSVAVLRAELQMDPVDRKLRFGGGFTFSR